MEYTRGDHFLSEIVTGLQTAASIPCTLRMPHWWSHEGPWRDGMVANEDLLASLTTLAVDACMPEQGIAECQRLIRRDAEWLADGVACMVELCAAIILDGWVLPRSPAPSHPNRVPVCDGGEHFERQLGRAMAEGRAPRSVLQKCYRWLKQAEPSPPGCLILDGVRATADASHAAWCEKVVSQRAWPYPWNPLFDQEVNSTLSQALGRSWAHRGGVSPRCQISQKQTASTVRAWGSSNATTPDLVPRIVFKMSHVSWDRLVWVEQRLMGAKLPGASAATMEAQDHGTSSQTW